MKAPFSRKVGAGRDKYSLRGVNFFITNKYIMK
jgi:hypothetical protein